MSHLIGPVTAEVLSNGGRPAGLGGLGGEPFLDAIVVPDGLGAAGGPDVVSAQHVDQVFAIRAAPAGCFLAVRHPTDHQR
ncbi:hypothetical protein VTG60DRAFT_663 [Thermothelomyces hinnuleus]